MEQPMTSSGQLRFTGPPTAKFTGFWFRTTLGLCFCLCAYLGNAFHFNLFYGVHYLFGGIFVWLAWASAGPFWAIIAAFVGATHTIELWGHPYGVMIFTLEAIFVCTFKRWSWTDRLSIWVLGYWILLGAPLGIWLTSQVLERPLQTALQISSQQVFNGLLNSLIAAIIINSMLYFAPKARINDKVADSISYSGLLHAIFAVMLIFPFLLVERFELRSSFKQNLASLVAHIEEHFGPASSTLSRLLTLETDHWGAMMSNLELVENSPEIKEVLTTYKSLSPGQIYALREGDRWLLLHGHSLKIPTEDLVGEAQYASKFSNSTLLGCHSGYFISLYVSPNNETAFVFTWSTESILSNSKIELFSDVQLKCTSNTLADLGNNLNANSVDIKSDPNSFLSNFGSWPNTPVVVLTKLGALSPTVLEMTVPLKPIFFQINSATAAAVQRLCLLAILAIIGGQLIDILFRRWIAKFNRVFEAYSKKQTHSSDNLNLNFLEDRQIANWLDKVAKLDENAAEVSGLARQNLKNCLAKATAAIFGTDSDGKIIAWNPALEVVSGYDQGEVLGKQLEDFLEEGVKARAALDDQSATDVMINLKTKSGKSAHLVVSQLHIASNENTGDQVIGDGDFDTSQVRYFVAHNLNELKVSHAKLNYVSRLAALGETASSFAHEVNQPLNVIALSAGSILDRAKEGSVPRDYLISKAERIEAQALRAGKVIQSIRNYVQETGNEHAVEFDLFASFAEAQDLISEQLRLNNVFVQLERPSNPIMIKGHPILFEQAMVNLLINSSNAMRVNEVSDRQVRVQFTFEGDDLVILVRDTGPGIPKEHLVQIFDPNFSTNKTDGGSGIGLFMTKTIVNKSNGSIRAIDVSSGACIEITFPSSSFQILS